MKICVIGLGYIGLPTAAMFANSGMKVVGVDKNIQITDSLNKGEILIEEEGLADFIKKVVSQGLLKGSNFPEEADAFIIAVPTPLKENKCADMRYVESATRSIVPFLRKGNMVILESTSPVGTVDDLMRPILEETGLCAGTDFFLGHSPERVIPGNILNELIHNNRIAGGIDAESARQISALYKSFVKGDIYETDTRTAELCKLSENTFRDINIAFANELSKLCEEFGVNVWELIEICNKHPRVHIHQPGPGVGGHCIAVDPWFIAEKNPEIAKIIRLSRVTNDGMPEFTAQRILKILKDIENPKVTILGITYKPDVDDIRESPILSLIDILKDHKIALNICDPFVKGAFDAVEDPKEAVKESDLIVLAVHHKQFKNLNFEELSKLMRTKNIFDTRNYIDAEAAQKAGFSVYLLGK
ncbi:MAG: nucleotide sugar dehydrogenase [Clostridia bacterium]|nr:nucleotide sugar dehydrogenase [Clostridia bacterium]